MYTLIFIYFIIFLKIWTGQSLLTVSLSKMHRQNLKKIVIFYNQTINIKSRRKNKKKIFRN